MNILEIIWVLATIGLIFLTVYLLKKEDENSGGIFFLTLVDLFLLSYYYRDILTTPLW